MSTSYAYDFRNVISVNCDDIHNSKNNQSGYGMFFFVSKRLYVAQHLKDILYTILIGFLCLYRSGCSNAHEYKIQANERALCILC